MDQGLATVRRPKNNARVAEGRRRSVHGLVLFAERARDLRSRGAGLELDQRLLRAVERLVIRETSLGGDETVGDAE